MMPQQQEYIITEGELQAISNMNGSAKVIIETRNKVRSRHAPAPEHNELAERECAINNCMRKDWLQRRDAAIATAAREQVYKEQYDYFVKRYLEDSGDEFTFKDAYKHFESLRRTQEQPK
jgi:hypothetical protein